MNLFNRKKRKHRAQPVQYVQPAVRRRVFGVKHCAACGHTELFRDEVIECNKCGGRLIAWTRCNAYGIPVGRNGDTAIDLSHVMRDETR